MSDFKNRLFKLTKSTKSRFFVKEAFCSISNIEVRTLAYQSGFRLVKYQVCYWASEPDVDTVPLGLLSLNIDNRLVDTFVVNIKTNYHDTETLISLCQYDFINVQSIASDDLVNKRLLNDHWCRRYQYDFNNPKIYELKIDSKPNLHIGRVEHCEVHKADVLGAPITLSSSTVNYIETDSRFAITDTKSVADVVYRNNDSFFTQFLSDLCKPDILISFHLIHY